MKINKIIMILGILLSILFSCVMPSDYIGRDERVLKTIEYYHCYVEYRSDMSVYGILDYWQYANETDRKKSGDCEDICIFVIEKIKKEHGIKCDLSILTDGKKDHAVISYNGFYYDPQNEKGKINPGKYLKETIEYVNINKAIANKRG
jgi:hypothetical protein